MPLSYKTDRIGQKRKGYLSKLFLGEKTFKSYPEDASTPEAAEEEAAKKAMTDIKDSRAHLALHPETAYGNAEEIQTLLGRIEEIVWEKPSGMFTNGIISEYESKYQERLPSCWMDLLKESTAVEIEALEIECGNVPKGAQFIVRPSKEASSGNVTPSSSSSKSEFPNEVFDTKVLQKNLVEISVPHVDEIQIPAGNEWQLYICCVKDVIFARLLDYDEDFCVLSDEMKEFYHLKKYPVKDVFESQVYAICEDDPNIWHRAIAVEIKEDLVCCYLVDVGEFVTVEKDNIQEIFPSFLALPFQAFMINLDGLEDYETFIKLEFLESNFLGRTLIAEVRRWWPVPDWLPENSGIHKVGYSVVLYDTSDNEDINMNDYLKGVVLSSLPCELPKQSISSCGYLTHITPEGKIYFRFSHPEANLLELELEKFVTTFEVSALRKSVISPNTVYVAKCSDGKWHRVNVSEEVDPDSNIIKVCLMDFGNTESVSSSNICELEPVCPYLVSVPSQAIICELFDALPSPNASWTEMATLKLREMAPAHEEIMIRVMFAQHDSSLPKVNLYKRNKDSEIVTINHTLCSRPELFKTSLEPIAPPKVPSTLPLHEHRYQASRNFPLFKDIPDVALPAEVQHMAKKAVSSSPSSDQINWLMTPDATKSPEGYEDQSQSPISLSPPEIPPKGKVFDVMVSLAAHPHNFIIQPLSTWNNLTDLGRKMEEFYSNEEEYCEIPLSLLKENNYYAALHADGCWYRVCLQNIIPGNPIMAVVYYVDYGEISPVSISNLQHLYSKFKQLPCQAIKASLYGVKPLEIDWDPIHCIKFKEMVENKPFVALVEDFLAKTDPVFPSVRVSLIDTSVENEDIYVHKILVESGIARMS
ncbi:tudor domain-containing protein 7-like [Uloborus diversus]|uniref:tudor domain-containing protein 7-like n=1 Tax=Uloborus diversus TaxID=327109 RepID=UPI00240A1A11|nr:tudor domain-containing protein 7-like [Uloborus diversus]